jgi:hypothetical protein
VKSLGALTSTEVYLRGLSRTHSWRQSIVLEIAIERRRHCLELLADDARYHRFDDADFVKQGTDGAADRMEHEMRDPLRASSVRNPLARALDRSPNLSA